MGCDLLLSSLKLLAVAVWTCDLRLAVVVHHYCYDYHPRAARRTRITAACTYSALVRRTTQRRPTAVAHRIGRRMLPSMRQDYYYYYYYHDIFTKRLSGGAVLLSHKPPRQHAGSVFDFAWPPCHPTVGNTEIPRMDTIYNDVCPGQCLIRNFQQQLREGR